MLRDNKSRHSPELWGHGLIHNTSDEAELRDSSSVLADRYRRGMHWYGELLSYPWWAWKRDRAALRRMEILRGEYRDLLEALIEGQKRAHALEPSAGVPTAAGHE